MCNAEHFERDAECLASRFASSTLCPTALVAQFPLKSPVAYPAALSSGSVPTPLTVVTVPHKAGMVFA